MKLFHEWDKDGCCIHCCFDGCEAEHLRNSIHPAAREPRQDYELYCSVRKNVEPTPMEDDWDDNDY